MNYIVLEGMALYALYMALVLFALVAIGGIVCALVTERRNFLLEEKLLKEKGKVRFLYKENFILKLKCGEIDFDEE